MPDIISEDQLLKAACDLFTQNPSPLFVQEQARKEPTEYYKDLATEFSNFYLHLREKLLQKTEDDIQHQNS